ncbi:hypothetical protein D3C71_1238760 [compost metagenome]
MQKADYFTLTTGLAEGETVQFVDGRWPGKIGAGIAIREEAFDHIEPHLRAVAPDWTTGHRYGVFQLSVGARARLAKRLRSVVSDSVEATAKNTLFMVLAEWLEERPDADSPVSILGL